MNIWMMSRCRKYYLNWKLCLDNYQDMCYIIIIKQKEAITIDIVSEPIRIRLNDEERNNMAVAADVLGNLYDAMMNYHMGYVIYGNHYNEHTAESVSTCIDMLITLSESNDIQLME